MSVARTRSNNKILDGLALYNLIGGSIGLLVVGFTSVTTLPNGYFVWGTLYFIAAYLISVISFFTFRTHRNSIWLGVYAILQLPQVTYEGFKYSLSNGVWFVIGLKSPAIISAKFELYTIKFNFALEDNGPAFFGFNIISSATLFYIIFFYKLPHKTPNI